MFRWQPRAAIIVNAFVCAEQCWGLPPEGRHITRRTQWSRMTFVPIRAAIGAVEGIGEKGRWCLPLVRPVALSLPAGRLIKLQVSIRLGGPHSAQTVRRSPQHYLAPLRIHSPANFGCILLAALDLCRLAKRARSTLAPPAVASGTLNAAEFIAFFVSKVTSQLRVARRVAHDGHCCVLP